MATVALSGGEIVARTLAGHGIRTIFSVSGNQILPVFDAAFDARVRIVHMRHETAAVYAAAAAAELTGSIGVALVSAGPGFLAALHGAAVARSMELPLLLLSGAAPLSQRGRGAFQDIDQRTIGAVACKASFEPAGFDALRATLITALDTATSDIPGPVHVALPADLLSGRVEDAFLPSTPERHIRHFDEAVTSGLDQMAERLSQAQRPAIVVRPSAARSRHLPALSATLGVRPIVTESPRGLSDPKYADAFGYLPESDCLLIIAPADFSTGFLEPDVLGEPTRLLLIDERNDPPPARVDLLRVHAAPDDAIYYLASRIERSTPVDADWARRWEPQTPPSAPIQDDDAVHPLAIAEAVRAVLRDDDILILDGGEFCQWMRLGLRDVSNALIWNGKFGAIGGSIPLAIGAATTQPGRRVIAILGDGSAGYHLSEFETAARYGLRFTAIVGNDARWAAEWHMQAARYGPDRTFDTDLTPARYDQAANGYGGGGALVTSRAELGPALDAALASPVATCLNVHVAPLRSPAEVRH
jgi:acetolactate synthase I/II/III large subunit